MCNWCLTSVVMGSCVQTECFMNGAQMRRRSCRVCDSSPPSHLIGVENSLHHHHTRYYRFISRPFHPHPLQKPLLSLFRGEKLEQLT